MNLVLNSRSTLQVDETQLERYDLSFYSPTIFVYLIETNMLIKAVNWPSQCAHEDFLTNLILREIGKKDLVHLCTTIRKDNLICR